MHSHLLKINPEHEKKKIVTFLQKIFKEQKSENAVIGLSGGIDSTVSLYLLKEVLPPEHIFVAHLSYFKSLFEPLRKIVEKANIPEQNIHEISIKEPVDVMVKVLTSEKDEAVRVKNATFPHVRLGNIAARIRMIALFDLAKKYSALVCGTENKSENLLGYFTRFGDQASDIEPIAYLYKTQVYTLANYLGIPQEILDQQPTAGLWQGQTDEGEFGFTYQEADQVLSLFFDEHKTISEIEAFGFMNTQIIINRTKQNEFKHKVPYIL